VLYSRRGCHLCESAEELLADHAPGAAIVDVDAEPALAAAYGTRVPVIAVDGEAVLEGRFDERALLDVIRRDPGRGGRARR